MIYLRLLLTSANYAADVKIFFPITDLYDNFSRTRSGHQLPLIVYCYYTQAYGSIGKIQLFCL